MRELELIDALAEVFGPSATQPQPHSALLRGIGDDAAVVRGRGYAVTSVDTMVDGVHFRTSQLTPEEIGHRSLAAALSDLAAMGAPPGEAYLALGLPRGTAREDVIRLATGAAALARAHSVAIAGGDVTVAPALSVSVAVVGWADDPGALIGREGAEPGDLVGITGRLGGAGAGLALLDGRAALAEPHAPLRADLHRRYARPEPCLGAGQVLAQAGAHAMIDLSDGLATDAGHLARASGVHIELELARLPLADGVEQVATQLGHEPHRFAASAGEDYELCVCAAPAARGLIERVLPSSVSSASLTWIGRVTDGPPGLSFAEGAVELSGYEHLL